MIAYLERRVIYRDEGKSSVIVENNGVGYEVVIPEGGRGFLTICEGETIALFIHTHVREDNISLYGFRSSLQREIFNLLLEVKDIGPRLAVTILSAIDEKNFVGIIASQDLSSLSQVKGIGKAKAERIIMELKNKIIKKAAIFNTGGAPAVPVKKGESGPERGGVPARLNSTPRQNRQKHVTAPDNGTAVPGYSDIILESCSALESLGYSRVESLNVAGKVYRNIKKDGASSGISASELTKECLKYIYSQKNV